MPPHKFRPRTIIEDNKFIEVASPKALENYVQTNQLSGNFFVNELDKICLFKIRSRIFEPVLTAPHPTYVTPHVVMSSRNKKSNIFQAFYSLSGNYNFRDSIQVGFVRKFDSGGPYFEQQRIIRPVIDATCVRVCKQFNNEGTPLLYGKNVINFDVFLKNDIIREECTPAPPAWFDFKMLDRWQNPLKTSHIGICQVLERRSHQELLPWLSVDPFLRFLHIIGPFKASLLQHMAFSGNVGFPNPSVGFMVYDFVINRKAIYADFMTRFCTNLRKLTFLPLDIRPYNPPHITYLTLNHSIISIDPSIRDDLPSALQEMIPRLTTLVEVKVLRREIPLGLASKRYRKWPLWELVRNGSANYRKTTKIFQESSIESAELILKELLQLNKELRGKESGEETKAMTN